MVQSFPCTFGRINFPTQWFTKISWNSALLASRFPLSSRSSRLQNPLFQFSTFFPPRCKRSACRRTNDDAAYAWTRMSVAFKGESRSGGAPSVSACAAYVSTSVHNYAQIPSSSTLRPRIRSAREHLFRKFPARRGSFAAWRLGVWTCLNLKRGFAPRSCAIARICWYYRSRVYLQLISPFLAIPCSRL